MSFEKWKARLAICQGHSTVSARRAAIAASGIKTFEQPGPEDEGYYRKPITEPALGPDGKTNGQKRLVGWVPVAYFVDNLTPTVLRGLIGTGDDMRDMTDDEVDDGGLWTWVVSNPISYETYVAVAENGEPWPDQPQPIAKPAITLQDALKTSLSNPPQRIAGTDNAPTEPEAPKVKTAEDYKKEIQTLIANSPVKVLTSDEEAAIALGSKNTLAAVRLEAGKIGKAIYDPLRVVYETEREKWLPMVNLCDVHEKKLNTAILTWREKERVRLAAVQAAAARAILEEEERNQRAADRAIANGQPEPEPEVTEIVVPTAALPRLIPTAGTRSVREEIKTFVTITDAAKVANHFIGSPELLAVLQSLAERATKLGQEVPGTTTRKGLV